MLSRHFYTLFTCCGPGKFLDAGRRIQSSVWRWRHPGGRYGLEEHEGNESMFCVLGLGSIYVDCDKCRQVAVFTDSNVAHLPPMRMASRPIAVVSHILTFTPGYRVALAAESTF